MKGKFRLICFPFLLFAICSCKKLDRPAETDFKSSAFFDSSKVSNKEVKKLIRGLSKSEKLSSGLQRFIRKNGMPRWDKVAFKTISQPQPPSLLNASPLDNDLGLYIVPFQSPSTFEVLSYLTVYQHNDSLYTYRLYNKDSLSAISPTSAKGKMDLLNALVVFGFLEQEINSSEEFNLTTSFAEGTFKNIRLDFSDSNGAESLGWECSGYLNIELYYEVSFTQIDFALGDSVVLEEWYVVGIRITTLVHCNNTGGGYGDTNPGGYNGENPPPGGGGSEYDDEDPNTPNWWDYGTGWPYGLGTESGGGFGPSGSPSAPGNTPTYNPYTDPESPYYEPGGAYTSWFPWWTNGILDLMYDKPYFDYSTDDMPIDPEMEEVQMPFGYSFDFDNYSPNLENNIRRIGFVPVRGNDEDMGYGTVCDLTGIKQYMTSLSVDDLFDFFEHLLHFFSTGQLETVADLMLARVRNNTGGEFTNSTLNGHVADNTNFKDFLVRFGVLLNEELESHNWNIASVPEIVMNQSDRPVFNGTYNRVNGLQILINDTRSTELYLVDFSIHPTNHNWTARLNVIIHDNFGLDRNDALTYQDYHDGFAAWWILQHCRNFKPFRTKVAFTIDLVRE